MESLTTVGGKYIFEKGDILSSLPLVCIASADRQTDTETDTETDRK